MSKRIKTAMSRSDSISQLDSDVQDVILYCNMQIVAMDARVRMWRDLISVAHRLTCNQQKPWLDFLKIQLIAETDLQNRFYKAREFAAKLKLF